MSIKGLIKCLIIFFLCSYCYAAQEEAKPSSTTITIADKQWKLGFKDENKDSLIQEYVINNETVNNWTELFTFRKFKFAFPTQVTPDVFAENQLTALKSKGYQYLYTKHETSPQESIVEFRITSPVDDQQDELQRIIKTPNGEFIILHYAVRKSDMTELERQKWITALKNIDLNSFN